MPKFRQKYGQFVVEGRKAVEEVFHSGWQVEGIWATQAFVDRHAPNYPHELMSEEENKKCTAFDTAPGVMALVAMPKSKGLNHKTPFVLALDGINDPGNMGTIIRLADWFGLTQIVASPDSVDAFNPKCLSATMGSFLRVEVVYAPLESVAEEGQSMALICKESEFMGWLRRLTVCCSSVLSRTESAKKPQNW